jgi:predicted nuclease with RNAse H fold
LSQGDRTWIGVDPGGKGNFGVAILQSDGSAYTCCVNHADEAIKVVRQRVKSQPAGVGVDAPLWWSSGVSSDRLADQWIRHEYKLSGVKVLTASSLRGAALVQGVMFVERIRQLFPNAPVTETHPKALLVALDMENEDTFRHRFSIQENGAEGSEHQRDAVISAVAAREGFERRWKKDLSTSRYDSEQDPSKYWLAPIHYFWPDSK